MCLLGVFRSCLISWVCILVQTWWAHEKVTKYRCNIFTSYRHILWNVNVR